MFVLAPFVCWFRLSICRVRSVCVLGVFVCWLCLTVGSVYALVPLVVFVVSVPFQC